MASKDKERNPLHVRTEKATVDDFKRFLRANGVPNACNLCGNEEWDYIDPREEGEGFVHLIAAAPGKDVLGEEANTLPAWTMVCTKCAQVRMHAVGGVSAWLEEVGQERVEGSDE